MSYLRILQPVVDAFDPRLLVAPPMFHTIDFTQMKVIIMLLSTVPCALKYQGIRSFVVWVNNFQSHFTGRRFL